MTETLKTTQELTNVNSKIKETIFSFLSYRNYNDIISKLFKSNLIDCLEEFLMDTYSNGYCYETNSLDKFMLKINETNVFKNTANKIIELGETHDTDRWQIIYIQIYKLLIDTGDVNIINNLRENAFNVINEYLEKLLFRMLNITYVNNKYYITFVE